MKTVLTPLAYQVTDFCQAIGIGKTAFYDLLKAGKIKTVVIGGRRLIPAEEAHRLVREGCEFKCMRGRKPKMSDIPRARAMLQKAAKVEPGPTAEKMLRYIIREALKHLDREPPEFIAPKKRPALTVQQVMRAKELRAEGLALHEIVRRLGGNTDIGRVSEAINGKRDGI